MDIALTASIRCSHVLEGGVKAGRQCGKEKEYSELGADPHEVVRNFQERAEAAFVKDGWLTGKPKDCRCPDHN